MPFVSNEVDRVKAIAESRWADGTLKNPPAPVASIAEQRAKRRGKGKSDEPKASDGPSCELRYSWHCEQDTELKIGGPTGDADGRIDTTFYVWRVDKGGAAYWRCQDPVAMSSHAHKWLSRHMPDKVTAAKTKSLTVSLTTHMVGLDSSHHLPKVNSKLNLIPLRGQYLSLTSDGSIRCLEPDPNLGLTYCIGAAFDPSKVHDGFYRPAPVNPKGLFGRYLATTFVDDEVRNLAQEAFSTVLINRCFEKSVWMYGEGENGKSLMLHLMEAVVGGRSIPVTFERLVRDQFGTSSLQGMRIATLAEAPKRLSGQMQDMFKQVVSWDAMPLERKGRDAVTFRPAAVLLVACNQLPAVGQHEHGFWRKVLMLPFTQTVKEKIDDLEDLIVSDPAEMAQVVDWLLVGAQRLIKRGGKFSKELPVAVQELAHRNRIESDSVAAFMEECEAEACTTAWTSTLAIYSAYRDFCADIGKGAVADSAFWTGARRLFPGYDIASKQGPAVTGKRRERYVPLRVQGVAPLDPMRCPAGWTAAPPLMPTPAATPGTAPVSFVAPLVDSAEWSGEQLDAVVKF